MAVRMDANRNVTGATAKSGQPHGQLADLRARMLTRARRKREPMLYDRVPAPGGGWYHLSVTSDGQDVCTGPWPY